MRELIGRHLPVHIGLGKDDGGGYAVEFAGDEDAVQEGEFYLRKIQRYHHIGAVQVGGDDVCLPGQVGRAPDEVVAARKNFRDDGGIPVHVVENMISHGDGVGDGTALEADFTTQHGRKQFPFRQGRQQVMAACVLDDRGFHYSTLSRRGRRCST